VKIDGTVVGMEQVEESGLVFVRLAVRATYSGLHKAEVKAVSEFMCSKHEFPDLKLGDAVTISVARAGRA
jgi:hypothetical protein